MKWITNLFVGKINEFNAENMRKLSDSYKSTFSRPQRKYIKRLEKDIIRSALAGANSVYTLDEDDEPWVTKEFLDKLKEYFEELGFNVEIVYDYCRSLKIKW